MKSDEKRSHRLNYLLRIYMQNNDNYELMMDRALKMGISRHTAESYCLEVIVHRKMMK